ncbi:hypothetical protein BH23ACT9_BH23ACT9_18330 [soil metagenome]
MFLAVGTNFADALAASGPAAVLNRPILLTERDALPATTLLALTTLGATDVTIVGGTAAVSQDVADQLTARGLVIDRAAGDDRYATAVALARKLIGDGHLGDRRPVIASGTGDGRTSPDALTAGPVVARNASPLLLSQPDGLPDLVAAFIAERNGLRGLVLAGGPVALSEQVREQADAAAR